MNAVTKKYLPVAVGGVLLIGIAVWLGRKFFSAAIDTVGGVFSGNNAVTAGTPYAGTGVLGTLGGSVNAISGGAFQAIGETISSWFTPNVQPTGNLYYTVTFPDGKRHAIVDTSVDRSGYFTYQGTRYRLGISRDNARIAVAA